jgi:hypothetical protein
MERWTNIIDQSVRGTRNGTEDSAVYLHPSGHGNRLEKYLLRLMNPFTSETEFLLERS